MKTDYFFSSIKGDVPVTIEMWRRPFVLRPLENHSFLILGDFFNGVRDFVWQKKGRKMSHLLSKLWGRKVNNEDVDKLVIRYEKYGTLYNIASVEAVARSRKEKFAVSAALLPEAKSAIDKEFAMLGRLNSQYDLPYIPWAYLKDQIEVGKGDKVETFIMVLSNWFEDYHEWHFTGDINKAEEVVVWDTVKGNRSAKRDETYEIIRQVSKILSLYYNTETYHHIHPWHHGAGDFVVKTNSAGVDVRLISVRGYERVSLIGRDNDLSSLDALVFFFLDMTIKMRLDKAEGMGEPVWAGNFVLPAILDGFTDALRIKDQKDVLYVGKVNDVILHLKNLSEYDLYSRLQSLIEKYRKIDPVDFACMKKNIRRHATDLYHTIQNWAF